MSDVSGGDERAIAAADQLLQAAQTLLAAYRAKHRRAMGGISEKAPFREEFARLAVATNECQLHPLTGVAER